MSDSKQVPNTGRRKPPNAGKGRPKGSANKVTREVKEAILNAFTNVGGESYLQRVAKKNPAVFCTLLGKVLPLQVTGEGGSALVVKVIKFDRADCT